MVEAALAKLQAAGVTLVPFDSSLIINLTNLAWPGASSTGDMSPSQTLKLLTAQVKFHPVKPKRCLQPGEVSPSQTLKLLTAQVKCHPVKAPKPSHNK